MNSFDIAVIVILVASTYFGFQTGLVASLFYVASGFLGMWSAQQFAPEPKIDFYLVFAATAGVVVLLGFVANRLVKKLFLEWLNKSAGILLGMVLGVVIIGTIVFPLSYHLPAKARKMITRSYTGDILIPWFRGVFPKVQQFEIRDLTDKISLPKMPDSLDLKIPLPTKKK